MSVRRLVITTVAATATAFGLLAVPTAPTASADPIDDLACTAWDSNGSCYYPNCTAAHAAGVCDIPQSSPYYCPKQDRDGDGYACEC